ncbi:MAG: YciE/YciF ferroxidase family protein [Flavisolibacter sp.]
MEKMNDLKDLLRHEIQDLHSAEDQLVAALPLMIGKANNTDLKRLLSDHLLVTEQHRSRLEKVQDLLGAGVETANEKKGLLSRLFKSRQVCRGMKGLIDEGNRIMREDMHPDVLDAVIIACAQKIEHYEICAYGTARTFARELNLHKISQLLEESLNEEYATDDQLTRLAVTRINRKAGSGAGRGPGRGRQDIDKKEKTGVAKGQSEPQMQAAAAKPRSGQPKRASSGKSRELPQKGEMPQKERIRSVSSAPSRVSARPKAAGRGEQKKEAGQGSSKLPGIGRQPGQSSEK